RRRLSVNSLSVGGAKDTNSLSGIDTDDTAMKRSFRPTPHSFTLTALEPAAVSSTARLPGGPLIDADDSAVSAVTWSAHSFALRAVPYYTSSRFDVLTLFSRCIPLPNYANSLGCSDAVDTPST